MGIIGKVAARLGDGRKMSTLPAPRAVRPVEQPELLAPAPSRWSLVMLGALQDKQVYQGTVPAHVTKRRRAKNKVARATRRVSRQRAK